MKRILVSVGDVSGDIHASNLIKRLKLLIPNIELFGIGGNSLREEGMELFSHLSKLSVVGFYEIKDKFFQIKRAMQQVCRSLDDRSPDIVLLIDYPGFNLRLARVAKKRAIRVVYYIPPQLWAWGRWRIRALKRYVDKVIVILPFEREFYHREGIDAEFVGHPLLDSVPLLHYKRDIIGLLPGSRTQEIKRILPVMLSVSQQFRNEKFVIPLAEGIDSGVVNDMIRRMNPCVEVVNGGTHEIMARSKFVLTASGTATLEAAIMETPMLVIYKVSFPSWLIGKIVVKVPYISLVNIVSGKKVVPEFVQWDASPKKIALCMKEFVENQQILDKMRNELRKVKQLLGEKGASERAARIVYGEL